MQHFRYARRPQLRAGCGDAINDFARWPKCAGSGAAYEADDPEYRGLLGLRQTENAAIEKLRRIRHAGMIRRRADAGSDTGAYSSPDKSVAQTVFVFH